MKTIGRTPEEIYKWTNIIWVNFLVAPFLILYMGYHLTNIKVLPFTHIDHYEIFVWLFIALSLSGIICAYIFWKRPSKKVIENILKSMHLKKEIESQNAQVLRRASVGQTMSIIISAYCEACVCYGLFLVILGGEFTIIIPFMFLTLISLLIFRPSKSFFDRVAKKLENEMNER